MNHFIGKCVFHLLSLTPGVSTLQSEKGMTSMGLCSHSVPMSDVLLYPSVVHSTLFLIPYFLPLSVPYLLDLLYFSTHHLPVFELFWLTYLCIKKYCVLARTLSSLFIAFITLDMACERRAIHKWRMRELPYYSRTERI